MQTLQHDGVTIRNGAFSASCALHKEGGGTWSPSWTARRRDTQAEEFLAVNKSSGDVQDRSTQLFWILRELTIVLLYSPWVVTRIRLGLPLNAKKFGTKAKIGGGSGPVEVDEPFVGGRLKDMHKDRRERFVSEKKYRTGGSVGKTVVMRMLDRDLRQVRARVVPNGETPF